MMKRCWLNGRKRGRLLARFSIGGKEFRAIGDVADEFNLSHIRFCFPLLPLRGLRLQMIVR